MVVIYTEEELKEKIKALDDKIDSAQSQVSFNGRSVSFQISELSKQRDRYQSMLDDLLARTGKRNKKHRIKFARF